MIELMLHWDGATWTEYPPPHRPDGAATEGTISVWGTSADNAYAVSGWEVMHFDGTTWRSIPAVSGFSHVQVFGSGADDVYITRGSTEVMH